MRTDQLTLSFVHGFDHAERSLMTNRELREQRLRLAASNESDHV